MELVVLPIGIVVGIAIAVFVVRSKSPSIVPSQRVSPINAARREKLSRRRRRVAECVEIETRVTESDTVTLPDGHYTGFDALVVDVWNGKDFTLRHRAVGLGWLPFVGVPEHVETPGSREAGSTVSIG